MKIFDKFGKFYIKLVFWYTGFFLLIMTIVGFPITSIFIRNREEAIIKDYFTTLTQLQEKIDTELIVKMNMVVSLDFFQNPYQIYLGQFFSSAEDKKYSLEDETNNQALSLISDIVQRYQDIQSIFLYRKYDDLLLTSSGNLIQNASISNSNVLSIPSIYLHQEFFDQVPGSGWISPIQNNHYLNKQSILSYFQLVPVFGIYAEKDGMIVVNIDVGALSEKLRSHFINNTDQILVVDPGMRVMIFSKSNESTSTPPDLPGVDFSYRTKDEQLIESTLDGNPVLVFAKQSRISSWSYMLIVQKASFIKSSLGWKFLIYGIHFLITISGIITSFFLSAKIYHPFKLLIFRLNSSSSGQSNPDEFSLIDEVIVNLESKADKVIATLKENSTHIQYKLGMDILSGAIESIDDLNHRLESIGLKFDNFYYRIIIIRIVEMESLSYAYREYIRLKIMEVAKDFFHDAGNCIALTDIYDAIILILNSDHIESDSRFFSSILPWLKSEIGLQYTIAVSEESRNLFELNHCYINTMERTNQSFFHGFDKVFLPELQEHSDQEGYILKDEDTDTIVKLLNSRKYDILQAKIHSIAVEIEKMDNDTQAAKNAIHKISQIFVKEYGRLINAPSEKYSDEILDFNQKYFLTLQSFVEKVDAMIDLLKAHEAISSNISKANYADKIKEYILNHLDNKLSLNSVADHFGISPNYLSSFFKLTTEKNFSDFIVEAKLEKASKLLLEQKRINVAAIANELGYSNHSYFDKLFKERFGLSPIQYRKSKQTDD